MTRRAAGVALALTLGVMGRPAGAQEGVRAGEGVRARDAVRTEDGSEHHHTHHVALFLGASTVLEDEGASGEHPTRVTVGADYERRLPAMQRLLGVGALCDVALGDAVETLVAPFLGIHPGQRLMVLVAPGVAFTGAGQEPRLVGRAAVAYSVHFGAFAVAPTVNLDVAKGSLALVYGLALATGF